MFAITLLESLACATPIIATDRCGLADFVRHNDLGSIVNYGDVNGLKDEIVNILRSPDRSQTPRALWTRVCAGKLPGWDNIAETWGRRFIGSARGNKKNFRSALYAKHFGSSRLCKQTAHINFQPSNTADFIFSLLLNCPNNTYSGPLWATSILSTDRVLYPPTNTAHFRSLVRSKLDVLIDLQMTKAR